MDFLMSSIFNKIGFILNLSIIFMIIYKLKSNPQYFDYVLVVALFWYLYAFIFDRESILKHSARDCIGLGFAVLLLFFHIVFLQKILQEYIFSLVW